MLRQILLSITQPQITRSQTAAARTFLCLTALGLATFGTIGHPPAQAAETPARVDFAQVRRILSNRCFQCHGPDENAREADLRLDTREGAESVLLGTTEEENELLRRIVTTDADEQMPPADSNLTLSAAERDILRRWVAQGSPFGQHWSYTTIQAVDPPQVKQTDRVTNEVDQFILAQLERQQLSLSSPASKERLIRRVSFDLTGLPPTIEEIDAYLADDAPDAYEKLVNRLLAKPAYGERMTTDWLDVARYADSFGYQHDRERHVWPWRDWVIKAFNENMPLDQFITWQLAGDLLPNATDEQILATTFSRLHSQKVEGGTIPEEFRTEYVADRAQTVGTAFLGMTFECARCHDHKFDPISQKEYYQLFAFFNNIDEAGLYSYHTRSVPTPTLFLTSDEKKAEIAGIEQRIAAEEENLIAVAQSRDEAFAAWLEQRASEPLIPGQIAHLDFEEYKHGANQTIDGQVGSAVQLTGDDGVKVDVGNFRRFEPFSVALWMNSTISLDRAVVFHRSQSWTDAGSRGYQLLIEDNHLSASLIHFWPGNAMRIRTREAIPLNTWQHVTITYDGSSRADGLKMYIDGQLADTVVVRDKLRKNIIGGGHDYITIGERNRDRGFTKGKVDEFKVFDRELSPVETAQLHDGQSLNDTLAIATADLTDRQRSQLRQYYLSTVDEPHREQLGTLRTSREERSKVVDPVRELMVMREMPQPRQTHLLTRGAYDAPADPVSAGTPAIFPPFPSDAPRNRLGLARWLTDPSQPLTARVIVNRYWQLCFGDGLVRTPEDFGSQGEPPTHPQLLDWLAHEFLASGWDVKSLLRTIVTSSTYRQSSVASAELVARDPDNRLLARGARYRLSAEMIRDNALATSGLLVSKIGGEPVKPYEVAVSFKPVARDKGEGLYRRSLYTFWKRTAPAPVMMSLDASRRDVCTVQRERTSSPLQALVLLNDPQLVEAARVLGQEMLERHGDDVEAMASEMFRRLTSREPETVELAILVKLYRQQLAVFKTSPDEAAKFLAIGDHAHSTKLDDAQLAAAGVLANALMNYDECVTKR